MIRRHLAPTLVFLCLGGCPAEDVTPADAGVDARPPEADGAVDSGVACDCCGTAVGTAGGETCLSGVCDPWCGWVDPCGASCDRATSVCVIRHGGADAGPPPDGGAPAEPSHECVPRPAACDDVGNCGGPTPDPSCDASDPCFDALDCAPHRVIHVDYLFDCLGA